MDKEQIDEIAMRVAKDFCINLSPGSIEDFTHDLLAELAKFSEPVCYAFKNNGKWSVAAEAVDVPGVIPLYLYPAPSTACEGPARHRPEC